MSVLLAAENDEPNLPMLKRVCEWAGVKYVVLTPYDLARSTISWSPWDAGFVVALPGERPQISCEWTAVWTRRSKWPTAEIEHVGERFTAVECIYFWNALLHSLDSMRWMNSIQSIAKWDNRLIQTRLAKSLGWAVPETLVCTDPALAREFLVLHEHIVIKHLSAGGYSERADKLLFTKALSREDIEALGHVIWCPTLLQRRVNKVIEVRAIVVENEVFAAGIQPLKDARSEIDGRLWLDTDLRFARIDLGAAVNGKLVALTKAMGLAYGAVDLMVDDHQDLYFLELNCSGQWGFIEHATGYPITEKIVTSLSAHG